MEKKIFQELPVYNTYIEKPNFKRLKSIDLHSELPFYEKLRAVKTEKGFRGYAMTYKAEIIDEKDPLAQLEASKSSVKDISFDHLDEAKGFKYQITLKAVLKKYKKTEIEISPV